MPADRPCRLARAGLKADWQTLPPWAVDGSRCAPSWTAAAGRGAARRRRPALRARPAPAPPALPPPPPPPPRRRSLPAQSPAPPLCPGGPPVGAEGGRVGPRCAVLLAGGPAPQPRCTAGPPPVQALSATLLSEAVVLLRTSSLLSSSACSSSGPSASRCWLPRPPAANPLGACTEAPTVIAVTEKRTGTGLTTGLGTR